MKNCDRCEEPISENAIYYIITFGESAPAWSHWRCVVPNPSDDYVAWLRRRFPGADIDA